MMMPTTLLFNGAHTTGAQRKVPIASHGIHRIKRGSFLEDLFSFSKHFGHGKTRISESIRIARRHEKDYGNWDY